jgi:alkylhydroperoxidase family enzyme
VSDEFDAQERAVLAYVDALVLEHGRVQEAVFDALRAFLDDEAILELSYAIGTYTLHATLSRALRLEYDDVPERVVEIPAPGEAAASVDIMKDISR